MKTDYQISNEAKKLRIEEIAKKIGIEEENLIKYGNYMAKIDKPGSGKSSGKLILVTSINPTSSGEGKSTVTIGLSDALNLLGKKSVLALREPSLGPTLGRKGGATGGGYAQVVPMDKINLHFTGDLHAITSANNAIMALINNHIFQGNELGFDKVEFSYAMDMNERALRSIDIFAGRENQRSSYFVISVASEIMAILCLAEDLNDLKERISNILVGYKKDMSPIYVKDLGAQGVATALLKDAFKPNLVQTIENNPAIIHGGPFANIAHGCNSVVATKAALEYGDYVVTEAGFGADLGAEKFLNIKSRSSGIYPKLAVVVATIRAIKRHGGMDPDQLEKEDLPTLEKGIENLEKHIENLRKFNLPVIVALNQFSSDTDKEIRFMEEWAKRFKVDFSLCQVWEKGGKGAIDLAEKSLVLLDQSGQVRLSYSDSDSIEEKINKIAKEIYGADFVEFSEKARQDLAYIEKNPYRNYPVCMAKTESSLSDNPSLLGRPKGFTIKVEGLQIKSGARFVIVYLNKVLTMPGLGKEPNALCIDLDDQGNIINLF